MDPELVQRALTAPAFGTVRRRVFRQLVESLLYEDALQVRRDPDGYIVDGSDGRGAPVRYRFTARRRHGFHRVALDGPVYREGVEAESPSRFLGEVRERLAAEPERLARFARELEETLVKDALAEYARRRRGDVLAGAGYDTLEGTVTEGHRYHPTYKSRIGFDLADNLAFGPEFAAPIRPLWLAAGRECTEVTVSDSVRERDFLRGQLGESTMDHFTGIAPEGEFTLLPVHPWQWRERIVHVFAEQLRRGELRVLGNDPDEFRAQQSIRTLACRTSPERPYLKLALSIVNTSTERGLAPHTVRNAPLISDWLRRVVAGDEFLRTECGVILLGEVLGSAFTPDTGTDLLRADSYGALGCVWRESLHDHLEPGESAVPFTGLTARELDGSPLLDPWVRARGPRDWLIRLVRVSVPPLVHLLCAHGIALEAHAQNMVLVHRDGVPARVALKDFHDGVRFSRDLLAEPDLCPRLAGTPAHHHNRNSFVETEDPSLVTDFLLDAFFFINLGELAIFLAESYGLDEREFWAVVRAELHRYRERFPGLAHRSALFDIGKPRIAVEKLTTRRLLPDTELRLHPVPNPLAEPEQ
ncbi:IucA/IucC family protein [Amycolatopsis cihanbeyliensis]|uniref:Siderophore synthetase component n=1 Tax=Amycolatopsis cihanbeyliensis TaxID=1128664 RepID=A0A542DNI1_AMYCI|nr:IucA/IucC family protein [Amycolatopsis cihanbeyliensis]TQJ04617.1 siderophore synthetase component [Amycolatopsis cihanbeyliensis]